MSSVWDEAGREASFLTSTPSRMKIIIDDETVVWGEVIDPRPIAKTRWGNSTVGRRIYPTTANKAVLPKDTYEEKLALLRKVINS